MKVLHLPFTFLPEPPGGTEVYVQALCGQLKQFGITSVVAAPGTATSTYEIDGLRVRRFAHLPPRTIEELYVGDPRSAAAVAEIIDDERPDVVHQHALTAAVSPMVAAAAHARGVPVVFTYHTPTATCQRGTLLELGIAPCDGEMLTQRCVSCTADAAGAGVVTRWSVARVPRFVGSLVGKIGLEGGVWTAVQMRRLVEQRHASVRQFLARVDRVVSLAPWVANVLTRNGVDEARIVHSSHGVDAQESGATRGSSDLPLRIIHLGRLDPTKGTETLIRALRLVPTAPVVLDIFGMIQTGVAAGLRDRLQRTADGDSRIRFFGPLAHDQVVARLAQYHLVAVPSRWMETGPLVALEAFAAGTPVIASDLGGLSDKIRDGVDGVLVRPFGAASAWSAVIDHLSRDASAIARLQAGVRRPRSAAAVAEDMRAVYEELSGRASFAARA